MQTVLVTQSNIKSSFLTVRVNEDVVRFMFLKPLTLILTYCKRKSSDKFVL